MTEVAVSDGRRRWEDLPLDVLSVIFEKSGALQILVSSQFVCRHWCLLSHDPRTWSRIVFSGFRHFLFHLSSIEDIIKAAVDRADGGMLEFTGSIHTTDEILKHIAQRNHKLRCLRLVYCDDITKRGLMEACKSFPLLEELQVSCCSGISAIKSVIGRSFSNLKALHYDRDNARRSDASFNKDALAIANNLSGLVQLRLFGNKLNEQGMHAILDGCPLLQSLDVRRCFQLDFGDDLKDRCKGFASLKLPLDSLHDYPYHVYYISEDEEEMNSLDTCSYAQDGPFF